MEGAARSNGRALSFKGIFASMSQTAIRARLFLNLFLLFALISGAVAPAAVNAGAQEPRRERRVTATPTPSPSPSRTNVTPAAPTPTDTPFAAPTPAPEATPAASPTPFPTATPAAGRASVPRTVEELRARIEEITRRPELAPSQFAIEIASLDTGRILFEQNAEKLMVPASNMKMYTIATALARLTPAYRYRTSVYAAARPDTSGTVRGDLIVYGRGDPSFAARFNNGDYFRAIDELAASIAAAGVRRIEGNLVGDESYFTGEPLGSSWEWDDLQWWYGAEVSALSINDNSLDLNIRPGTQTGAPSVVTTGPETPLVAIITGASTAPAALFTIQNNATTAPRGSPRTLRIHRAVGQNILVISGQVPLGDSGFSGSVSIPRPAQFFVSMLRASLAAREIQITGRPITVDAAARAGAPLNLNSLVEIASRQSPPLSEIAAQAMKPSHNLYTELMLRTVGRVAPPPGRPDRTSAEAGLEAVRAFLGEAGADTSRLTLVDGSGLSRQNLITAHSTIRLLTYLNRHAIADTFRATLPIAGVDGTLRSRMRGTRAEGNARAKTGTLQNVSALSGYVTSAAGERLAFSLIINHFPEAGAQRTGHIDAIVTLLASFAGRS